MMNSRQKRMFYIALTALLTVLFVAGLVSGYVERHNSICPDKKPPLEQQDTGLGTMEYLCHDGKIVTK